MDRDLFLACEAGDLDAIQILHGHVLNGVTVPLHSALDIAETRGHLNPSLDDASEAADVLLDRTFQGDTALHIAARNGHLNLVTWILADNPSLAEARNKDGNTPLHEGAKCQSRDVVEEFLKAKQSSNDRPFNFGNAVKILRAIWSSYHTFLRAIWRAIWSSDYTFLRAIWTSDHTNKFGETPLMIASQYGHVEIVKLLLYAPSSQYVATAPEVQRSLREAAYRGYKDVFEALLNKTRSPNIDEDRILHIAVQGGHLDILKVMLNHSSWRKDSMIEKDKHGRCAIHVAAMKGRWEIINELMSRMPDSVQIRSSDEKSVLHFAIEYDQFDVVSGLLTNIEADKAVKMVGRDHDHARNTAFHFAAVNGASLQILEILLPFRGDNINALNDEGKSTLDIASSAAQDNLNCAVIAGSLQAIEGIRSNRIPKSNTTSSHPSNDWKERERKKSTSNTHMVGPDAGTVSTHMVVSSLIATITFAAMFQIPGGIEDDQNSIHYGAAKLAFDKVVRVFIFFDTVAFTASITVVVVWLIQQQLQGSNPGSSVIATLSDFSEASLLVSIFWTVLAFVTATITVIIPQNLQNLKSKDKEAFSKYELLLGYEISLAVCTPILVPCAFYYAKNAFRRSGLGSSNLSPSTNILFFVYSQMVYLAILVLCFSFK